MRLGLDVTTDLAQRQALRRSSTGQRRGDRGWPWLSSNLVVLQRALAPLGRLAAQARRINPAEPSPIRYTGSTR